MSHVLSLSSSKETEAFEKKEKIKSLQQAPIHGQSGGKKSMCKSLVVVISDEGEYKSYATKQCKYLGPLVRCCVAFGVYKLLTIPYYSYRVDGSFGSDKYLRKNNFNDWNRLK